MNSTDSEFWGYVKDRYTTLKETHDRILATEVDRPLAVQLDRRRAADAGLGEVLRRRRARHMLAGLRRDVLPLAPADPVPMGSRVIDSRPEIDEIRLSLPNKHHFLVDLEPFGLEERQRGLLRGRPPVRPDRGHGPAGRRRGPHPGPHQPLKRQAAATHHRTNGSSDKDDHDCVERIVIENCAIATVDAPDTEYASGHVVVAGNRIESVGAGRAPEGLDERRSAASTAPGTCVTPGLVNTHHHFYQWITRGLATDHNLFDWLVALYPTWARIDEPMAYAGRPGLARR